MIKYEERKVQKVHINEVSMAFLCSFYKDASKYKTALMLYKDEAYFTNVTYEEVSRYSEEKDLMCFLKYLCRDKEVENCADADKKASSIFRENPDFVWILVKDTYKSDSALFVSNYAVDVEKYSKVMKSIYNMLQSKGVFIYLVRIPDDEDILQEKKHLEWSLSNFSTRMNWSKPRRREIEKYLYKFTDLGYDDARKNMCALHKTETRVGNGKRTIFLVGPCIVGGFENCRGETLADILYEKIVRHMPGYQVEAVQTTVGIKSKFSAILECDIRQNDIVIWIDSYMEKEVKVDLDLTDVYNHYNGDKWLYSDMPIHTTKMGNELIADELIKKLIEPAFRASEDINDQKLVYVGENQLTCDEEYIIYEYLKKVKSSADNFRGEIGACVVTCNPFTKGHYFLIDYASKKVDFLYVFVVEEDAFYFSFEDRIEMVRRGTACFDNVMVFPSGRFMISKETFWNYFEKEVIPDAVIDAAKDVMVFKNYVAPFLGISKRFVGSEPEDHITEQYNRALKECLRGSVEVIEVPRKENKGAAISAGKVRQQIKVHNWQMIEELVPHTTLEYIQTNLKRVQDDCGQNKYLWALNSVIEYIQSHQNIVICGLGKDAEKLMRQLEQYLDMEDIEKLIFYDKKIAQKKGTYRGKRVISFEELVSEFKDYYMVIATSRFKMDLLCDLAENEIEPEHIRVYSG